MSLLRRAIEGLTAERQNAPDYSETLGKLDADLEAIKDWCSAVSERPALKLTPGRLAGEIVQASEAVRAEDRRLLQEAQAGFSNAIAQLNNLVARARAAERQRQWVVGTGLVCGIAGLVLGLVV